MESFVLGITTNHIIGALGIFILTLLVAKWDQGVLSDSLPQVGYGKGFLATIQNFLLAYARHKVWVEEGYEKYTKNNRPFIVPWGFGRRSAVVLPQSQIRWLLEQSDEVISADEANNDSLYARYNFLGNAHPQDPFNNRAIGRNLIRALGELTPGMQEEVQDSIDREFGLDTQKWKSLNIWDMWLGLIPQITNRMVLGKDLGRNSKLLSSMVGFTESVLRNVFLLDFLPRSLHPLLGPLLAIPNWFHHRRAIRMTLPVIQKRLMDMERKANGDPAYNSWTEPEDFITWCIRQARLEGDLTELKASKIAQRTLLVEVASIHTTAMTAQNAMIDILAAGPSVLEALREEADRVFREENYQWSKAGLAKLYRIDSAIRESQRRSNFAVTLLDHKVIAREGITHKDEGWHIPYGSTLTLNLNGIYHDPDLYENPESYDAFRYSRPIEKYAAQSDGSKDPAEGEKYRKMGMVTTSETHLIFGHGRHACPGRFFVAHELKLAIAYMVLNYDLKNIAERPAPTVMGNFILPSFRIQMQIRRRDNNVQAPSADNKKIHLTGAQETMLGTLLGRFKDAQHPQPILNDLWAGRILDQIDYDFAKLKMDRMQFSAICMRSRTFDRWTTEFIERHEDTGATVICLACGLDSRSLRLRWGPKVRWIDLDLPDVVALRRKLLPTPGGDYRLVDASVMEDAWLQDIPTDRPTLILLEGLVMYLTEEEGKGLLQRLVERFPSGQLIFDAVGSIMIAVQHRSQIAKATGTSMYWGLDQPQALEALAPRLRLRDIARFGDQDGANELPLLVRCVAWALSHVPYIRDVGYVLRYEF
ncbi:hypothetical protein CBS147332_73 [Penicillium roqueforti]|nr:hypothetical protein CBS147332_73 [Penicillium roqueforti]KAI3121081.1 hypothetical protein CBS147331_2300 [Penicillium roqueforti]